MAIDKQNRSAELKEKTKHKMRENLGRISFLNENNVWVEHASHEELDYLQQDWMYDLMKYIPYRQHCNFFIDPSMISGNNALKEERVFAYACFLP